MQDTVTIIDAHVPLSLLQEIAQSLAESKEKLLSEMSPRKSVPDQVPKGAPPLLLKL